MDPQELMEHAHAHAAPEGVHEAVVRKAGDLTWVADPHDPRRSHALVVGDPAKAGPYTVQLRAPAGYSIGLHLHPKEDEHLTVLSGVLFYSSGAAGSGATEYELRPGSVALSPAGVPHRLWATEETVVQMSGVGPRVYVYVNPADDPRIRS